MELKTQYKFIFFEKDETRTKGLVYICKSRTMRTWLGRVFFYPAWRQFIFAAESDRCIFSHDCLADIGHFLRQLNEQAKTQEQAKPKPQAQVKVSTKCSCEVDRSNENP